MPIRVIALGGDTVIGRHDQERAHREGIALAGGHHRVGNDRMRSASFGAGFHIKY